ncbi:MAG TPA: SdrD B-like domain-containing protein [Devosia sp.]|nr:SdrD B-like domain-containing protein [Devosia sp.]
MAAGGVLPYQLRVDNNDNDPTPPTQITFAIPAGAEFIGVTGLANCVPVPAVGQPATVTCDVPALSPAALVSAQVELRPMVAGIIALTGTIPSPGPTFTRSTTITRGADLTVDLTPPASPVQMGSSAAFSAVVTNIGPYPADQATLTIPVPAGLSGNVTLPSGCSIASSTISCAVPGPLAVGASVPFHFASQVTTADASTITIAAAVSGSTPIDGVNTNNADVADIAVTPGTDVSLTKTRAPQGLVLVGDTITFTLQPRLVGISPAAASITDSVPANYAITAVTPVAGSGWNCPAPAGQAVSCAYTAGSGTSFTAPISITATAILATDPAEGVTNHASISAPAENTDAGGNNDANDGEAFIATPTVDLVAVKAGPPRGLVTEGNSYIFSLRSYNQGNSGFSGPLTITDRLPAGLTLVSANVPTGWTCGPALPLVGGPSVEFSCTTEMYAPGSELEPGESTDTIELTTAVTASGAISNEMLVWFDDYTNDDALPGNNTTSAGASSADPLNWSDLSVRKTLVAPLSGELAAGEQVTFEIEIANSGPSPALNVVLDDRLSDIVGAAAGGESLSTDILVVPDTVAGTLSTACVVPTSSGYSRDLQCTIPTLPVCTTGVDCPKISVTVRAGSQGAKVNTAIAFSTLTPDPDTGNNEDSANYLVTPRTDVTVEKASPSAADGARAGQELVYVLTAGVPGNGLSDAAGVSVTDTLPTGLIFLGATASTGSCAVTPVVGAETTSTNRTLTCNLGTIVNGAQQTVTVRVVPTTALVGETVTNGVVVSTSTPEPNQTNNTAELPIEILPPELDLIITKTDTPDPVEIDADVTYTVTVRNTGPSDAFDVVITDDFPTAGFVNPRFTAPTGTSCALNITGPTVPGGELTCSLAHLPANSSTSVTVLMKAVARGRYTNNASVTSAESTGGYEAVLDNNASYEDTSVRERADLSVTKVPSSGTVDLREEFSWTITTTNKSGVGLGIAEWVTLVDTLPVGMELTRLPVASVGTCTGAVGGRDITCEFGDMAPGAVVTVTLYTKITSMSAQAASNSATASTHSFEQTPPNNTGTGSVALVRGGTVSGTLYRDFNANNTKDSVDTGITGITMTLTGTALHDGEPITITTTTASNGTYSIGSVPPGTYSVAYGTISEGHLVNGAALPGTAASPESVANGVNRIDQIIVVEDSLETRHDFTRVPVARVGLSKVAGAPLQVGDGSYTVAYTFTVKNLSLEPLIGLTVTDVLDGATQNFGTYAAGTPGPGQYTITSVAGANLGGGAVNTAYTGAGVQTLASGMTVASNASATIAVTVRVNPVVPRIVPLQVLRNQASVTGTGSYSGQTNVDDLSNNTPNPDPNNNGIATDNNTPTTVTQSPTRSILLDKVATPERTTGIAAVGDRINYSFTVTNTGKTPLFNVTMTDPLPNLVWVVNTPIPRLDPAAVNTTNFSAYYILTQADLDSGQVPNTAQTTGQWGVQSGTPVNVTSTDVANVPALSSPGLTLLKEVESTADIGNPRTDVGDEIRYKFTVTNTGNTTLRNVTVTDALAGVTADPTGAFAIGVLTPGQSTVVYADYAVTLANINAGRVDNSATAKGTYGPGTGTPITTPPSTTSTPLYREPDLTLVKELVSTIPAIPLVGTTLRWEVTATNTGNVTLSNLVVTDPFPGATVTPASVATLVPGGTAVFTVTAPLSQADIEDGQIDNTARINFNSPEGPEDPVDAPEVVPLPDPVPAIALSKNGDVAGLSTPPAAGEEIVYTIVIRNTGNVALENITLTDLLPGVDIDTSVLDGVVLQPQNAAGNAVGTEITVLATYAITTADIEAGSVVNTAVVDGDPVPGGPPVTDRGGTTFESDDPTTTVLLRGASISLVKTVTSTLPAIPQAGDEITFGFRIENTGNVTLTEIDLVDHVAGVQVLNPHNWTGPLAPGGVNSTAFTGSYVLTQADIDAGTFANTATVTGKFVPPVGEAEPVNDTSGTSVDNDDPTTVNLTRTSDLSIVKSATPSLRTPPLAGDTIEYQFVVTNIGNVTLTNVVVNDPLLDAEEPLQTIPELLPGAANAVAITGSYTVTQADIEAGEVENQANATYSTPTTPGGTDSNIVIVELDQAPSIAIVKTASSALSDPATIGELITYSFTVTNTGNVELTDVEIDDPLEGLTPNHFDVGTLAPGETSEPFTATYAIVADDIRATKVVNQAVATGTHGGGPGTVDDPSGPTNETDEPTEVPVLEARPGLAIEKTASFENGGGHAKPGDLITYRFHVTNTGNIALDSVAPRELDLTFGGQPATGSLSAITPAPTTLGLGESADFTATYALTQDDLNNSSGITDAVANTADAVGIYISPIDDDTLPVFADPDDALLTLPPQEPADITIAKRAMLSSIRRGETAGFVIEVTNASGVNAGLVDITDSLPPGFVFVEGSATVDGVAVTPVVAGSTVTFEDLPLAPNTTIEIGLVVRALASTSPGTYLNTATGVDYLGTPIAPPGRAEIRIEAEAVFDCSEVIGKVFDDLDSDGYQDQGEPGLPGVRVSTVRGTLITTDAYGRFSIPCADLPDSRTGSNFVLKLDTRTLPTGFGLTTDNPAMVRLTAGKMTEINFGASVGRQIKLGLDDKAFVKGSAEPTTALAEGLTHLVELLGKERTTVTVSYAGDASALARQRIDRVISTVRTEWDRAGAPYELVINTEILER